MNPIARVSLECWIGQGRHVIEREDPSEKEARELFERLDGSSEDTLSIETADHGSLLVGGGPERFVAVSFLRDGASFHAERGIGEDGIEMIQVGGQVGDYPKRYVLDRESAWEVAKEFFRTRTMTPAFTWVRDVAPEKEWSTYPDEPNA
jgi:hypothetical protein